VSLAQACCLTGGEKELLSLEMEPVLQQICSNAAEWRRDSHHLYIFDTLIRRGGEALGAHLALCIPVFALAADHQRDADVRSTLLLLLDDLVRFSCPPSVHSNDVAPRSARRTHSPRRRFARLCISAAPCVQGCLVVNDMWTWCGWTCFWQLLSQVRQEELYGHLAQHAQTLLDHTIVPVCVWRAGKVAGALRKASVSCMTKLMQAALIPADGLMLALGKGFEPGPLDPVLKSCLDDDDADVRFMTCGVLAAFFVTIEGRLDDEQVVLALPLVCLVLHIACVLLTRRVARVLHVCLMRLCVHAASPERRRAWIKSGWVSRCATFT
jgi:hypothetical protein